MSTTFNFLNCKITTTSADFISASSYSFSADSNTEFNFDFDNKDFLDATSATISNKEEWDYTTFGLSAETNPIIINSWITSGYDTGLFGEERKSIGAFYFMPSGQSPSIPILISPISGSSATSQPITFVWSASDNADSYNFQYSTDPTFSSGVFSATGIIETQYQTSVSAIYNKGNYNFSGSYIDDKKDFKWFTSAIGLV